jgi:hypothetical protein
MSNPRRAVQSRIELVGIPSDQLRWPGNADAAKVTGDGGTDVGDIFESRDRTVSWHGE